MCGIAGYIGSKPPDEGRIAACLRLMHRRGPDGQGSYVNRIGNDRTVVMLSSRLDVQDPAPRSDQPFLHGDTVLSYNGEIYNFVELRAELEQQGERFTTTGDTEILSRLLARDGADALDRCEGMWAFAFHDTTSGTVLLSRDRFGEKPLYLFEDQHGLTYASEPKFIFSLRGSTPQVNLRQVRRLLVNGYKSLYKSCDTFFEGLREIAPGQIIRVERDGLLNKSVYWSPNFDAARANMSFDTAVEGTRERLIRSVKIRLRSDVPLAFCLSGGIDSNALVSIAHRTLNRDVHAFTIVNKDSRYEEKDLIDLAVRSLDIRHTEIPISTQDFLPQLRTLVRQHDAPVYTITYFAHWLLMRAVAEAGYKVSISGTGADELFSGYYDHHNAYLHDMMLNGNRHAQALGYWQTEVAPFVRNPFLRDPDYFIRRPDARDHIYLDAENFAGYLTEPFDEPFVETIYSNSLLRNRMANELMHESVPVILHEDDRNAMYFSVENRSPFLDSDLFEWCQSIPTAHLIQKGRAKAVLRAAIADLVPAEIADNPRKVGFNAPIGDFLDVDDPNVMANVLDNGPIFDLVKKSAIESLFEKRDYPNSESKFLFNFLSARFFLEEFSP